MEMDNEELIKYWLDSSDDNHRSMRNMFDAGEYVWALFVGHLCLEKLLKAYYIKMVDRIAPRTHDLYKIAVNSGLEMTEKQKDDLQYVTLFNIESRYEEYKRDFYQKCTKEFTEHCIDMIEGLRTWLLKKISG